MVQMTVNVFGQKGAMCAHLQNKHLYYEAVESFKAPSGHRCSSSQRLSFFGIVPTRVDHND